jgi:predicted DNA-binding protein (MmcQ/YjbR family)
MTSPLWDGEMAVREISLSLPFAEEKEAWGDPTFRIRNKIFVMVKRGDGRVSAWLKSQYVMRDALVATEPERFFVPPYVGSSGWLGVDLHAPIAWEDLHDLIVQSYRYIAPKRLASMVSDPG